MSKWRPAAAPDFIFVPYGTHFKGSREINCLLLPAKPQLRPGYSATGVNTGKSKATAAYRLEVAKGIGESITTQKLAKCWLVVFANNYFRQLYAICSRLPTFILTGAFSRVATVRGMP